MPTRSSPSLSFACLLLSVAGGRAQESESQRLSVDDLQARRGDTGVAAVVRLTTTKAYQGYSVVLGYDRTVLFPTGVDLTGTATDRTFVEFTNLERYPRHSVVTFDVLAEFGAPFEGKTLPPGESVAIFKVLFDVLETAPEGEGALTFPQGVGEPPLSSSILVEDVRMPLEGSPGKLTILPPKPPPSENRLSLGSTAVQAGEEGEMPVLATVAGQLEAYTVIVGFDPAVVQITALDLAGSSSEPLAPELVAPRIENEAGYAALTVIFDFLPPLDRRTLAPGEDLRLFTVRFRVAEGAPAGAYPMDLRNEVGRPPLNNIFVFGAQSFIPELVPGEIVVGRRAPSFVRGDYDSSGLVDLADAVSLVNHLFQGAPAGACDDAGDADDTGLLDLSDAIQMLNHLFQGGPPLAAPYPEPGEDPSPDDLGCATEAAQDGL